MSDHPEQPGHDHHDDHDHHDHHDDGYAGPVTVVVDGLRFTATARFGGCFQPLDGHYRWYGRLDPHDGLTRLVGERTRPVSLETAEGTAEGRITEPDLWHRYRIEGAGVPPFRIRYGLEDAETH
jgi:hypothetical protein